MKKKNRKKWLLLGVFLACFLLIGTSIAVLADTPTKGITEPVEIYKNYKDNTFPLMTGGTKDLGKFEQIVPGISTAMKEFAWAGTRMVGNFNANLVSTLFGLDIISPVKHMMMTIASSLASSLTSIGSTVGICVVAMMMLVRYIASHQFRAAIKVFLTAVLIFTGLAIMADGKANESLFNKALDVDEAVNAAIINVNPVFDKTVDTGGDQATPKNKIQNAGAAMASSIFYANVYQPYLLLNYGTSDGQAIRSKGTITVNNKNEDRIDGVLKHENMSDRDWKSVIAREDEKLKNHTIHYRNNWLQMLFAFFYFLANLIQTIVFFFLGLMRLAMGLIEVLLIPVLPILLLLALFQVLENVWGNYAKAFGVAIITKGVLGFCIIMFASYISLGFNIASKNSNIFDKLITIAVYVLAPVFVYFFRNIFTQILTGRFKLSDIPKLATNPIGTVAQLKNARAEQKERAQQKREAAQRKAKEEKAKELAEREQAGGTVALRQSQPKKKHSTKRNDFNPRKERSQRDEYLQAQPNGEKENYEKNQEKKQENNPAKENERNTAVPTPADLKNQKKEAAKAAETKEKKETTKEAPHKEHGPSETTKAGQETDLTKQEQAVENARKIGTRRKATPKEEGKTADKQLDKKQTQPTQKKETDEKTADKTVARNKQPQQKVGPQGHKNTPSAKRKDVREKPTKQPATPTTKESIKTIEPTKQPVTIQPKATKAPTVTPVSTRNQQAPISKPTAPQKVEKLSSEPLIVQNKVKPRAGEPLIRQAVERPRTGKQATKSKKPIHKKKQEPLIVMRKEVKQAAVRPIKSK